MNLNNNHSNINMINILQIKYKKQKMNELNNILKILNNNINSKNKKLYKHFPISSESKVKHKRIDNNLDLYMDKTTKLDLMEFLGELVNNKKNENKINSYSLSNMKLKEHYNFIKEKINTYINQYYVYNNNYYKKINDNEYILFIEPEDLSLQYNNKNKNTICCNCYRIALRDNTLNIYFEYCDEYKGLKHKKIININKILNEHNKNVIEINIKILGDIMCYYAKLDEYGIISSFKMSSSIYGTLEHNKAGKGKTNLENFNNN